MASQRGKEFADFFKDASSAWDLERLYKDLADAKQTRTISERRRNKDLTQVEKTYLRGLLCGNNPDGIAQTIYQAPNGVRVALCNGLYRYVETLIGKRPKDWRDVSAFLEQSGYKVTLSNVPTITSSTRNSLVSSNSPSHDWGEAPDISSFFGRSEELVTLKQWLLRDRCRLVAILGMRGVGKTKLSLKFGMGGIGKTDLSLKLAEEIQDEFEFVIWRSLLSAPKLTDLISDWIKFLSSQEELDLSNEVESKISRLLCYLRSSRCLLILDNVETILQDGSRAGQCREGYEDYDQLFKLLGEVEHKSCLLLTSREKPQAIAIQEGKIKPVRSLLLSGLKESSARKIFEEIGNFNGSDKNWEKLINLYNGNPLALEIVARHIEEVFFGDIAQFLLEGKPVFGDINELLNWHFRRLTDLEKEVIYWLAINREPASSKELQEDILCSASKTKVAETLQFLQRKLPLERSPNRFTLQPVLIEYVLQDLIEQVYEELRTEKVNLINNYALIKATTKDHIRETQIRLILEPILSRLLTSQGNKNIEQKLFNILIKWRKRESQRQGYVGGNIINLLRYLNTDLTNRDFSRLSIWQACFENTDLQKTSLAYSNLSKSKFTHTFSNICCVAFGSNEILAVGDSSGKIHLWNLLNEQQLLTYKGHSDRVWSVAFSPDDRTLASVSEDQTVKLWNLDNGRHVRNLQGHTDRVWSVVFSPDGHTLASASDDKTVRIWDINTGENLRIFRGHNHWIRSIALSSDGEKLVSASEDQTIRVWNIHTGECCHILKGHTSWVRAIALSYDNKTLASASGDQTIKIWNIDTGECLRTLSGHSSWVWSVAFSPDGQILVSSSEDQTVRMWDLQDGECIKVLKGHTSRIWSVAFNPNGQNFASAGENQTVKIWDTRNGECIKTLQGYTNWTRSVSFECDGKTLIGIGDNQIVRIWDFHTGNCIKTLLGELNKAWAIAFSPDGQTFATGIEDHIVRLWDKHSGECLKVLQGHTNWVWSLAFSPDGQILASGSEDQTVRLWNVRSGECLHVLQGHNGWIRSVAFSPDGQILASGSEDQTVRLWNVRSGECFHVLQGHNGWIRSVAFSPDGQILASGSEDQTVRLWNVRSGECFHVLQGHHNRVWSVAFSYDGKVLATSSEDETVKLWDVASGKFLRRMKDCRPYEGMDITGIKGLTEAQRVTLKALGAIELEDPYLK